MMRPAIAALLVIACLPLVTLAQDAEIRRCRSYVQGRIDVLDAQLHKGNKPNEARKLVKRRDRLKDQLAACERNPAAYKKEL